MTVACPKCRRDDGYRATGAFTASPFVSRRAELVCACGYVWSSGLREALSAGEEACARQGGQVWRPGQPSPAPQPDLPAARPTARRQSVITPAQLQERLRRQRMRRARTWHETGGRQAPR